MDHLLIISEQYEGKRLDNISDYLQQVLKPVIYKKNFHYNDEMLCFQLERDGENFIANTNYYVGVDWLITEKAAVYVEPKLNEKLQVDFLGMLLDSLESTENISHLDRLFHADYEYPWIQIPAEKDLLSPVLIIQFLKLVQQIVRKGLKKSYYQLTENLNSRIKGKIKVGTQIKENIVKNRLTKTVCNYQQYGINSKENQFLKLVLQFVSSYLNQKNRYFIFQDSQVKHILNYCLPSFEEVDILKDKHTRIQFNKNVFYKEYEQALQIGQYILKRFSFSLNKVGEANAITPPFWIDMSNLFELYVFNKLKKCFKKPGIVSYHDRFLGKKETDILIKDNEYKCVADCKYKPQYKNSTVDLKDKRQVISYTRLKSVYKILGVDPKYVIKGLIIYSDQESSEDIDINKLFHHEEMEYIDLYKYGIKLPEISR